MKSLKFITLCLLLALGRPALAGPILDVAILVDGSGSLGIDGFASQQAFILETLNILPVDSVRVGIIQFATGTETIYTFSDDQDRALVSDAVLDMDYAAGYTNTVQALEDAIYLFESQSAAENLKSVLLLTDGRPYLPYGGDVNVCALQNDLFSRDIQTSIIGTGSFDSLDHVDCLLEDPDDFVMIFDFSGPTPGLQAQLDQLQSQPVPAPGGLGILVLMIAGWGVRKRLVR